MTTFTFDNVTFTAATQPSDIHATLAALPMNPKPGTIGLRNVARMLEVNPRKFRKAELLDTLTARLADHLEPAVEVAAPAEPEQKDSWANDTKRPQGDAAALIADAWELFTNGATIEAFHKMFLRHGVQLRRGAVASRLGTQRNNGNVTSVVIEGATVFMAAPEWETADMARRFLKIK